MPVIPPSSTFVSEGLNKHATFFGCNSTDTLTIIYLPNVNYTYDSGQSTERLQYSSSDTDAMIANGNAIGTQNNDPNWPTCLGCGIVKKTGDTLPSACTACFTKYCYN
jgi:lysophospholipase